ncbi:MAG: hypothetical protein CVT92_02550 [Bacteroidetes bacterium HGW-Bacteroidetes-1]|jgi:hypothetical protein|nr:MAG: hypothetical protein CVT92_02550 [Bacteroidetes bacterium HGW-Bacteroidetes-1]
MIKNNKVEEIRKILLKTLDNEGFVQELLEKYAGNEELILKMIEESFSELLEEANPYKWTPVSPTVFLTDPYYLGKNPETGIGVCETLHDQLFKDFCELHGPDSEYNEAILTGGIGWGKSFFMEISLLWQLYLLSCLKHPQKYFELASNTKITVMIISITEKQGKKNMFSGVKEALKIIPYFKENFQYDDKRAADSLLFPNNIELMSATSSHSSTIGLNIYAAALDEANFFKKVSNSKRAQDAGEIFDEALVLYQSVRRRLDARFLKKGHKPGIFYIGSSKVYPNDFTSERINKAMELEKEKGKKQCFVMDYNLWKVNRERYSKDEFRVEIGGLNRRSRILDEWDRDIVGEVIHVPMDFYDKFQSDIDNAIRDIAGIGIYTVQPFIGNKEYIGKMFQSGTEMGLERIFSVDVATLSPKPEYMALEHLLNVPIRKPGHIRYVGVDIGLKKDRFGIAVGYIDGMEQVERTYLDAATQTMKVYKEKMPKCVIELLLSIKKEEEFGEVELGRVRYLIFQMMKNGYRIRLASMDGFQSADFLQILKRNNIEAVYISMDKTTEPYETFRTALYEERIASVYHPLLELELNELERDYVKGKIDHNVRSCLLGDTKIKLLNGKHVPISELVGQENVELYGCNENGVIVPTIAKKIWETKKVKEYLEVTLDNGEVVKCTVEHPFMVRDGSYKRADELVENDSLMSFDGSCAVSFVITIISDEEIPVYDIEVPLTSNFALSAGIFVHNSKDLSDAVGQIIYHMHINPMYNETPLMPVAIHDGSSVSSRESLEDTLEKFNKWVQKG